MGGKVLDILLGWKLFIFEILYIDMFGIDDYYSGLIEEAKSPEEIKKILEYQFVQSKGVPQEVLDGVFEIDPTKKKSYTRWVLTQWDSAKEDIIKALKDGKLKRMFDTFKERAGSGLDLTNIESFQRAMEYVPDVDPCLTKEGDPNSRENQFDIVYDTAEWTIAVPHTYEADKKLGQGCRWCTAGAYGDHDGYWRNYSAYGPLWVNFDRRKSERAPKDNKEYPYTRYQFLFEYQNYHGELMDSDDHRVDFEAIDMPEEVVEFYGEQNPRYKDVIENNEVDEEALWEEYNEARWESARLVLNVDDNYYLSLLPEENEERNLNVDYFLYDENDTSDPIDYATFDPDHFLITRMSNNHAALLKDYRGNPYVVYYSTGQRWRHFEITSIDEYFETEGLYIMQHDEYIYVMPSEQSGLDTDESELASISLSTYDTGIKTVFINKQISEIANEQGIEGYYGDCFEIVYESGAHGLYMYDGYNVVSMIEKDYPINEEKYVATVENGQIYIKGRMFPYKFGENGAGDEKNLSFIEDLGEFGGNKYYLVASSDGNSQNVYDATNNKLVFDNGQMYNITAYDNFLKCKTSHPIYTILFDLETQKEVIPPSFEIYRFNLNGNFVNNYWCARNEEGDSIYFADRGFEKISGFEHIIYDATFTAGDKKPYVPVKTKEDILNLLDLVECKLCFPNIGPSRRYGIQGDLFVVERESGLYDFFCVTTKQLLCQDIRSTRLVSSASRARTIEFRGGGYNILTFGGKFLLPKNVEMVRVVNTDWTDMSGWVAIEDDSRIWFLDITTMKFLPNKEGIDLRYFKNFSWGGKGFSFTYKDVTLYIGLKHNELDVEALNNSSPSVAQAVEEVKALINREATQIRENFKKTLDMINNFYKDKD